MSEKTPDGDRKRKELRDRLERLNRGPLKGKIQIGISADETVKPNADPQTTERDRPRPSTPTPAQIVYRRDVPRGGAPSRAGARPIRGSAKLEDAVDGVEATHNGRQYFLVSSRVEHLERGPKVECALKTATERPTSGLRGRVSASCDLDELSLDDMIFMDIECTGLGATPLFLIGTMEWAGGGLEVRQFFARDYSEEAPVIASFVEACIGKKLLVTFNGKSFDVPLARARAAANGLSFDDCPAHFDLLHESRRVWGRVLPNCKLQTLESDVCGRARHGDIPGKDIPDAYHAYVHTGNAVQMVEVLKHNMLDLLTLADLMTRLPEVGRTAGRT